MALNEFFDYKNELMRTLCMNETIVKLITDEEDHSVPAHDLAYKYIFPFQWTYDTVDSAKTFVCFDVDIAEVPNKTFYAPVLYVWVFTHKSLLRLPTGGVRLDVLAAEIDTELNGNRFFGLGRLKLSSVTRFVPITDYQGRQIMYRSFDFNSPKNNTSPPANRRERH